MTAAATVAGDPAALEPHLAGWAELAAAAGLPLCRPEWMLAWWRQARPADAALRVVLVHDGEELLAVAPYFSDRGRAGRFDYRLLASGVSHRIGIVCRPGREQESATAIALALARSRPRAALVSFEGVDAASPWPRLLHTAWPGRMRAGRYFTSVQRTPVLELPDPGFEAWMAGRSSNFRQQMAQSRRRLHKAGGSVRLMTEPGDVARAVDAFSVLHDARWSGRGGSNLERDTASAMLLDAATALVPSGAMRLWCAETDDGILAVQVFLAAGGEVAYWNGGWDPAHAGARPALVTILAAVEDAFARRERRIDFGGGEHPYKLRFTGPDGSAAVSWSGLFPLNLRYPLTRAQLLPWQAGAAARAWAQRRPESRDRIVRLLRRT